MGFGYDNRVLDKMQRGLGKLLIASASRSSGYTIKTNRILNV